MSEYLMLADGRKHERRLKFLVLCIDQSSVRYQLIRDVETSSVCRIMERTHALLRIMAKRD
jgi:hypothetical protein